MYREDWQDLLRTYRHDEAEDEPEFWDEVDEAYDRWRDEQLGF